MKVLLDTNIVLDVFLNRKPFVAASAKVMDLIVRSKVEGYLCATTVTTVDSLVDSSLGRKQANTHLKELLNVFQVAAVNRLVLERALESKITDFEDAVIEQSALVCGADTIVTRNLKDFKKSVVSIADPEQLLAVLQQNS